MSKELEDAEAVEDRRRLEKVKRKEMVWRVTEEIFNTNNLEEIKHHLGALMERAIIAAEAELPCCRKGNRNQRKEGEAEQRRVFLEEELGASMGHSGRRDLCFPIGAFESTRIDAVHSRCGAIKEVCEGSLSPTCT